MPLVAPVLSALAVRKLSKPGLHAVGGLPGLCLQITERGARTWILRTIVGGKRCEIGLGGYAELALGDARERARELRSHIRAGGNPIAERAAARAETRRMVAQLSFAEAARRWHAAKRHEYRNAKHADQVVATLGAYAFPVIGSLPVADISVNDVIRVLKPIWTTKTETASRLRGRIESVLSWATVSGHRSGDNPARWRNNLDAILSTPGRIAPIRHQPALLYRAMPEFYARLATMEGMGARAVAFLALTATRSGEVRGARWSEIDREAAIWTIPAARMKAKREHRVPLSAATIQLLDIIPRLADCEYVFPSSRNGPLSDMTLSAVMRRMEVDAVPHGLRSTFRDWAAETGTFEHDVVEMALAHTITNKVEAAYRRGDLLAKRRELMDAWAHFCLAKMDEPS